jgi:hypothetical protein
MVLRLYTQPNAVNLMAGTVYSCMPADSHNHVKPYSGCIR